MAGGGWGAKSLEMKGRFFLILGDPIRADGKKGKVVAWDMYVVEKKQKKKSPCGRATRQLNRLTMEKERLMR